MVRKERAMFWIRIYRKETEIAFYPCRAKEWKDAEKQAIQDCYWYDGDKWEVFQA